MDKQVSGYIHSVSPLKTSKHNRKYFNAVMQTSHTQYSDVVCYAGERRSEMMDLAQHQTPVTLTKVAMSPSKRRADATDVEIDKRAKVEICHSLEYGPVPPPEKPMSTLEDVRDNIKEHQRVSLVFSVTQDRKKPE